MNWAIPNIETMFALSKSIKFLGQLWFQSTDLDEGTNKFHRKCIKVTNHKMVAGHLLRRVMVVELIVPITKSLVGCRTSLESKTKFSDLLKRSENTKNLPTLTSKWEGEVIKLTSTIDRWLSIENFSKACILQRKKLVLEPQPPTGVHRRVWVLRRADNSAVPRAAVATVRRLDQCRTRPGNLEINKR